MKKEKGFTLIELVIVIIILGILAAYAIPKFINLEKAARIATVQGISGTFRSTAAMVHGLCMSNLSQCSGGNVTVEGVNVAVDTSNYYPLATQSGIINALANITGGTSVYDTNGNISIAINLLTQGSACNSTYAYNGSITTSQSPIVYSYIGGC